MPRRLGPTVPKVRRKLNQNDVLPDDFLTAFGQRFQLYRAERDGDRLLSGIAPDPKRGIMTVRSAIILVLTLAAAREWRASPVRAAKYKTARQLSRFIKKPPLYLPSDVEKARRLNREWEANRIEALVALAFARQAGFATHSRALWRCIEGAIRTDGLGEPSNVVRSAYDVDDRFELIRARLNYWYKKSGKPVIQAEADSIFLMLSKQLQRAQLGGAALYFLVHAKHREV